MFPVSVAAFMLCRSRGGIFLSEMTMQRWRWSGLSLLQSGVIYIYIYLFYFSDEGMHHVHTVSELNSAEMINKDHTHTSSSLTHRTVFE